MTSLRGSLPPAGSAIWPKERRSSTADSSGHATSFTVVTHVVIREVWQKTTPSPHALYKIDVMTKSNHWSVMRRYREFSELHKKLVNLYGIPKDMLPPKKLTARLSKSHLEKRREALEHYLQRLVNSSTYVSSSREILDFLDVQGHDVMSVTKALARDLSDGGGEAILAGNEPYNLTPTQLYCITRQLQLPEPIQATEDPSTVDLGSLYSFIYHLQHLCINSSNSNRSRTTQELASHLEFDISLFKSLKSLSISGCPVKLMNGLSEVQSHLECLMISHSIRSMRELLVERVYKKRKAPSAQGSVANWRSQMTARLMQNRVVVHPWLCLTNLDLSHNKLAAMDDSLKLMPVLQSLNLSYNEFVSLDLQQLECPSLTQLDLSHNNIQFISGTPRDLQHLKSLILSHNNLQLLSGLQCLIGLIDLDIANNQVSALKEISSLMPMSQLRYLAIDGNPITKLKSYRVGVFSYFQGREIVLDNKPRTTKEKAYLSHHPVRARSRTSPELCLGNDSDYVFRHIRSQSYEGMSNSFESEDDNDSGIEGSILLTASKGRNPLAAAPANGISFNWQYYKTQADMRQMRSSPGLGDTPIEVQGTEEAFADTTTATQTAEVATEVTANEVSLPEDFENMNDVVSSGVTSEETHQENNTAGLNHENDESPESVECSKG